MNSTPALATPSVYKPNRDLSEPCSSIPDNVQPPSGDVRKWQDECALRGWAESSRRAARVTVFVLSDLIAGFAGVYAVLATWSLVSANGLRPHPNEVPLLAMVACLQPLALAGTGAYGSGRARTDFLRIAGGIFVAALLGWVQARLFGRLDPTLPNKAAYLYSAVVITTFVWLVRIALDRIIVTAYRAGVLQRKVIVIGSEDEAEELADKCSDALSDLRIVGRLAPEPQDGLRLPVHGQSANADGVPFFGAADALRQALSRTEARTVIVTAGLPFPRLQEVIERCFRAGAGVSLLPRALRNFSGVEVHVNRTAAGPLLQLRPFGLELPQFAVKRAMDIVLTLAVLVAIWPVLLLIAIAVKLGSCGPILFSQERAGVGGRPFRMLKFRTMCDGADARKGDLQHLNTSGDPRLFKIPGDPRVTRVGRLLRRTSLDELPQLLNVLKGDMSLVGPRPFFPGDLAGYDRHHFERLHVLPGITGLWQVSGRSDVVDFEEVVRLDREYIQKWSVWLDIAILFRTLPAVLGRGAY